MRIAIPELLRDTLGGRLPDDVEAAWYRDTQDVVEASRGADVLVVGFIDGTEIRAAVEAANGARWVSTHAGGVDRYPMDLLRYQHMLLTKGSGVGAPPIAEYVVMCMLFAAKSFGYFLEASARHAWPTQRPPASDLHGSRALIVGYGGIGRAVGHRLKAFGVHVTGVRRHPDEEPNIIGPEDWKPRLAEFDWILMTAALTAETRHVLGEAEFHAMKLGAWVINVARGGLIDQEALVAALHTGKPRGAFLDVTEPEPLPSDHPLWSAPNVVITGHSCGRGTGSLERYATMFLDNLERFKTGQPLLNVVDLEAGY